jgi:hypothetical protein
MRVANLPLRRAEDGRYAFPWRPVIVVLNLERHVLPAMDTQLLRTELNRLPADRYSAAATVSANIARGLLSGSPVPLSEAEQLTLLRALEGVRASRPLPAGLRTLREALVQRFGAQPVGN